MLKKLLFLGICITLSGAALATDYYVDTNVSGGANDGTSWANAWATLDTAMTTVTSSNTINIAAGTYTSSAAWTPTNNSLTIKAKAGDIVILDGDVNNNDTFADLTVDPCALDKACTSGTHSENRDNIFNFDGKTMTLQDLVIQGAKDGAITMNGASSLTATNCYFTQNYSDGTGGCIGSGTTGDNGGAMTLTNCKFIQNSSDGRGACIYSRQKGAITLTNCLFQISYAIDDAGCISLREHPMDTNITDCIFDRCKMMNNSGGGGGIMQRMINSDAQTTLTRCVFTGCTNAYAGGGQGAAYYLQGYPPAGSPITGLTVTIDNSLFFGNTATGDNSALHFEDKVAGFDLTVDITNCTIADNRGTQDDEQGAVGYFINFDNTGGTTIDIALKNTIIWGNAGDTDRSDKAQLYTDTTKMGYAQGSITADYCCWDNTDPNDYGYTAVLGSNNLLKKSLPYLDPLLNGYRLDPDSPCIDAGDPCSAYSAEPKCNGGRINMGWLGGTVLATPTATSSKLADLDCDDDVDLADFSAMADQWMQ